MALMHFKTCLHMISRLLCNSKSTTLPKSKVGSTAVFFVDVGNVIPLDYVLGHASQLVFITHGFVCVTGHSFVLQRNYVVVQINQFVSPAISLYYEVVPLYYNIIILHHKVITVYYKPISLYYRPSVCITKYLLCTTTQ